MKLETATSEPSQATGLPLRGLQGITDGHAATYSLSDSGRINGGNGASGVFSGCGADVSEAADVAATAARNLANEIEEAFLRGAFVGWEKMGVMMEKYDAVEVGDGGGGGEYDLQVSYTPRTPP